MNDRPVYKDPISGHKYRLEVVPTDKIRDSLYQPRERNEEHVVELVKSISREGLLIPLLLSESNDGWYEDLDGGHRLEACKRIGKFESLPAKVYVGLSELEKQRLCLLANAERKKPNAGETFRAESRLFNSMKNKMESEMEGGIKRILSEEEIFKRLGATELDVEKEFIIGGIVERLRNDSEAQIRAFCSDSQIPKKKILNGDRRIITAQNLYFFLKNLVRSHPVEEGEFSLRDEEYRNVLTVTNALASLLDYWISSGKLPTAIAFSRRHTIDAAGRVIRTLIRRPGISSASRPLYNKEFPENELSEIVVKFQDIKWDSVEIMNERNLKKLYEIIMSKLPEGDVLQ